MSIASSTTAGRLILTIRSIVRLPIVHIHVLKELGQIVSRNFRLLYEMAKREITDPFAGSYFGVCWSIAHPMILMAVYVVVFALIFRGSTPEAGGELNIYGFDFTIQMISAYLAWMVFTDVLVKSCVAVTSQANLAKQVVFPLEILPLKGVLASLLPQFVGTAFLLVYTLIKFHTLPWTWFLWPFLIVFEIILLSGVAFIMASIGVFIRDLKEIAIIIALIGFYTTPVLYSELTFSNTGSLSWLIKVLLWNPISYYVWPYRDAGFQGGFVHPLAWVVFPCSSVVVLVFGYRLFRKLKPQFGNAL